MSSEYNKLRTKLYDIRCEDCEGFGEVCSDLPEVLTNLICDNCYGSGFEGGRDYTLIGDET